MEWLKIETETYPSISNGLLTYLIANNCPYLANICPTYLPTHYGSECYTFKSLFCLGMQENQGDLNCLIPPSDIQGKKCLLFTLQPDQEPCTANLTCGKQHALLSKYVALQHPEDTTQPFQLGPLMPGPHNPAY